MQSIRISAAIANKWNNAQTHFDDICINWQFSRVPVQTNRRFNKWRLYFCFRFIDEDGTFILFCASPSFRILVLFILPPTIRVTVYVSRRVSAPDCRESLAVFFFFTLLSNRHTRRPHVHNNNTRSPCVHSSVFFSPLTLSPYAACVSGNKKKKNNNAYFYYVVFFFSFCRVVSAYNRLVLKNSGQPPPIRRLRHRFLVFRLLRRTVVCLARYSFPASSGQSSTRSCAVTTTNTLCNDWCCPGSRPRLSLARPPLIAHLFIFFFFPLHRIAVTFHTPAPLAHARAWHCRAWGSNPRHVGPHNKTVTERKNEKRFYLYNIFHNCPGAIY